MWLFKIDKLSQDYFRLTNLDACYNYWLFKIDKFSQDFLRWTNPGANFEPGQFQTAFRVARTNLDHLKMSLHEYWTKLDAINLSFCSSDKFRCSKLVFLKKETNSEFWIWPFSGGTNLDGLNLSFLQNDWFRWSKFVQLAWRTNFDSLNLSFLMWDKLRCSEFVPFPSSTNLGALNLSL